MQWVVTSDALTGHYDFCVVAIGHLLAHAFSHTAPD